MVKKTNLFKTKIFLSLILALTMLVGVMTSSVVYAHNSGSGSKAINVLGYQYVDQNTVKVFFDKSLYNVNQGQFKIATTGGTPVTISTMTTASGSGWSNSQAPGGETVILTTATALSANTTYSLTVSSTVAAGNSYNLTIGNYWLHKDISFNFKTPNADGTYSGIPNLTFIPAWDGSGLSGNIEVISDIPIDPNYTDLSHMKLQKSSTKPGTYTDVIMDPTLDGIAVTGAECYAAQINDAHTCLFLPETLKSTNPSYNLLSENYFYRLVLPPIRGVNAGSILYSSDTTMNPFQVGADTAGPTGTTTATITAYTSSSVSLSWSDVVVTDSSAPNPTSYKVYYSTNPYFNFTASTNTITHSGTTNSSTVTGLSSGTTYYFRIVPVNFSGNEGGFSPYVSQTTN